jgi:LemA protein
MANLLLLAIAALLLLLIALLYNRLVTLRERYRNAFAQVDVQLKRRYDLIPNLVEIVRGYMEHERSTLEAVIEARDRALKAEEGAVALSAAPSAIRNLAAAEILLGGALTRFLARVEAYPELKASANVLQLQEELSSTENRIAFARQSYNDAVMRFNAARGAVPTNLVAGMFGFSPAAFFHIDAEAERVPPTVSFG